MAGRTSHTVLFHIPQWAISAVEWLSKCGLPCVQLNHFTALSMASSGRAGARQTSQRSPVKSSSHTQALVLASQAPWPEQSPRPVHKDVPPPPLDKVRSPTTASACEPVGRIVLVRGHDRALGPRPARRGASREPILRTLPSVNVNTYLSI